MRAPKSRDATVDVGHFEADKEFIGRKDDLYGNPSRHPSRLAD